MKKIFITGGAGFIGSNIIEFISNKFQNVEITIYDNLSNGKFNFIKNIITKYSYNFINADLLDFDTLSKEIIHSDLVIHLAANSDIALSSKSTSLDLQQTVLATYNVLEAMRLNGVKNLIYSSGSGVYGDIGEISPGEDFGPLYPASMYGATKLSAEAMISAFSSLFEINALIFRFANVIGKNQTHGVAYDFINRLCDQPSKLNIFGDGYQSKSYVHVDDVIEAIFYITNMQLKGVNTFNLSSGDYITVREIAQIVVEEMKLVNVNFEFTSTPYGWPGDVPIVRINDNKLRELGWIPKLNSRDAMRSAIRSMLAARSDKD
ncbi:NAD-dependent epimerase/dehydratase family protein [Polynucleobacter sp. MG-6-Vaara-E2]|uniref:NAD-dependent epimerase/dehydratase family protein n=1 Tax=Polynucleobacter sp. MG-6-Vaara-E2 TaxID=2576932 RepID=UPI001BFE1B97|nr:NAD-dependent epimerase/dehydratase family protein [Polynucleobacter sp. MG-6-Vaara-E2]QWD96922.1 NAD-dependent epimerase/dehydratase family protein [Polynucleobacter sp. MG-6-Vaara-E2]